MAADDIGRVVGNEVVRLLEREHVPLVSVIVRSTGRATLQEALGSIAAQTYPNLEVVVVDALGCGHPAVPGTLGEHPVRLRGLGGPLRRSRAANVGLEEARGEYLIFLDDDDWFLPNHVTALVAALEARPEVRVAYAGVRAVGPDGEPGDVINEPFSAAALRCGNYIALHAALFRRRIVEQGFRFDEELDAYEDWDFWLNLSRLGPFLHVDQVSACYRTGGASGVGLGADAERQRAGRLRVYEKWRARWTASELDEVGEERNALALRLSARKVEGGGRLEAAESRLAELEERLVRIDQSWSIAVTRPLRKLKPLLLKMGRGITVLTKGHELEIPYRPHISTMDHTVASRALTGPLVSVVVPVYNACRSNPGYLKEALDSICQQTYTNVEVIIVDDGSTDDTAALCAEFVGSHGGLPIRYLRKENGGQSSARNAGVRLAKGEWIGFLDQDDVWFRDKLERVVPLLGDDVDLVYTDADTIDAQSHRMFVGLHRVLKFGIPHPKHAIEDCLYKDIFVMPGTMTVRRDLLLRVGGFDESLSGYEDDDLFVRLFPIASVRYLPVSTLWWRIYRDNYSNTSRMIRSRLEYWKKLMDLHADGGRNRTRAVRISRRFFREFLRQATLQRRAGKEIYRENLTALREVAAHLPLLERSAFSVPARAWCAAGARFEPVRLGLESLWRRLEGRTA